MLLFPVRCSQQADEKDVGSELKTDISRRIFDIPGEGRRR